MTATKFGPPRLLWALRRSVPQGSACVHCEDQTGMGLLIEYFRNDEDDYAAAVGQANDLQDFLTINDAQIRPITHPQQVVTLGAWSARVDVDLAPVILALWTVGIPTSASCAGKIDREPAYIAFPKRAQGQASFAALLHAQLAATVPSLLTTGADRHRESGLEWDPADSPAVLQAVRALTPPPGLAWNIEKAVVTDLYGWL